MNYTIAPTAGLQPHTDTVFNLIPLYARKFSENIDSARELLRRQGISDSCDSVDQLDNR